MIRNILFVELLGGIGDLIIALPAIHAVARSYPAAQLTVLTFAPGNELLMTDSFIHQIICAERGKARQAVDHLLMQEQFDLIISDTNYDGIADAIHHYQKTQSALPKVITNLWRSPPDHERVSQRFLDILLAETVITSEALPHGEPEIHLTESEKLTARHQLGASYRPLVVLCPEAGMAIKQWSADNFISLGKVLQQHFKATILIPAGNSPTVAMQISNAIGGTATVWPRSALRALAAMFTEADLVIAADTGVAHIAAALAIPTITLFGPSWAERYGHPAPHVNLQGFPECPERLISNFTQQRCWYSSECPYAWRTCLDGISPEVVLKAATDLLSHHSGLHNSELKPSSRKHYYLSSQISSSTVSEPSHSSSGWLSVHNLLVMRLDNIGDVIMTSPALRALRENLPDAKITLMASPSGSSAASLLPWIDQILPWRALWQDLGKLAFDPAREWKLVELLQARQFDAAIIFTSFSQSPYPAGFICELAEIPLRLGESKERDFNSLSHSISAIPDVVHQTDRNLHLIESVGFKVNDRHLAIHIPPKVCSDMTRWISSRPYILLNPWTSCPSRNYDPSYFAQAAQQLSDTTGQKVVLTGVEKDRDRSQVILEILGNRAIDLIGRTSLIELAALIEGASLVLTNNTSVMHLADATQTPMVVLFSGTEQASQWHPRHSQHRLLNRPTVCSPCYAMTCSYQLQCLEIEPTEVVGAGLDLLQLVEGKQQCG